MDKVVYNHLTGKTETTTMSADEQASLHIGFANLDKKKEACDALVKVNKNYPDSDNSVLKNHDLKKIT